MPTEREIQALIVQGANILEKFHLFKMIDAPGTGKKPFDISGIAPNGIGVGLEVKKIEMPQRYIPWGIFSPHQINWLQIYAEANAYSIIAIYYEATSSLKFIRLTQYSFLTTNKAFDYLDINNQRIDAKRHQSGIYFGLKELLCL